jgi:hypothetical protein
MKPFKGWEGVTTPPKEAARLLAVATAALPELTAYGVSGARAESEGAFEQTPEQRMSDRADLFYELWMIGRCADWMRANVTARKAINHNRSSYGLKHDVERASGAYVTNGSFIAAAIGLGFKFRTRGPNAYFNFSIRPRTEIRS